MLAAALILLPLLCAASSRASWHQFWYDVGIFGAHPTLDFKSFAPKAPELSAVRWDPRCEPGYVLLSPRGRFYPEPGPLIYDTRGELVWIESRFGMVMDLNVQRFRGEDFLTFWVGEDDGTRGEGSYYMLNSSYEVAHIVSAANGLKGDVHEFKITPDDTALMSIYEITQMDLTAVGRAADGWVYDGLFQEIDIASGALLFEWRARDHYGANDTLFSVGSKSAATPTASDAYDYFHINSIDKHPHDGSYLVSSRYLHSVTCIAPDGAIRWILGGKRNMFTDLSGGKATSFTWQHDARWHLVPFSPHASPDPNIVVLSLLDNGANEHTRSAHHSTGLLLALDLANMTVSVLHAFHAPGSFSSHSQGNLQVLPESGNVFVGWGKASSFSEFAVPSASGTTGDEVQLLCDTHYGPSMFFWFGWVKSYRVQKVRSWVGLPSSYPPDIAVDWKNRSVYVTWNGATVVDGWVLQRRIAMATSPAEEKEEDDDEFADVRYFPRSGFETRLDIPEDSILKGGGEGDADGDCLLRVAAVDGQGKALGFSRAVDCSSGETASPSRLLPLSDSSAVQNLLLASGAMAAVVLALWKSRASLPLVYLRSRRFVRRRFGV
ncbi:Arylsulfotransferase ASST [Aspergillus sp. HF37]|nr:Arylsulfotransferase ASST [Aspergillus sp. HF37]